MVRENEFVYVCVIKKTFDRVSGCIFTINVALIIRLTLNLTRVSINCVLFFRGGATSANERPARSTLFSRTLRSSTICATDEEEEEEEEDVTGEVKYDVDESCRSVPV